MKGDHHDDTEFIPHNASVISRDGAHLIYSMSELIPGPIRQWPSLFHTLDSSPGPQHTHCGV